MLLRELTRFGKQEQLGVLALYAGVFCGEQQSVLPTFRFPASALRSDPVLDPLELPCEFEVETLAVSPSCSAWSSQNLAILTSLCDSPDGL